MPPVLEIEKLTKRYKALTALDGVSLSIEQGEIFALLGPNGAGKTTLIGAVCGLVKKTEGKIRLFGEDLDVDPTRPRYRVGLVPQEVNFDPFFSVRECLEFQMGYFGQRPDRARVDELLAALNLTDKAEARTRELSGGMKRRLLIAKALVHKPALVFLDEPTAGVDVELRRDLWNYVRKLRSEGTTVVLTTHYLEEAEELADRVGIISKGKLIVVEEKRALLSRLGEHRLEVRFSQRPAALPELAARRGELSPDGLAYSYAERPGEPRASEVLGALYAASLAVAEVAIEKPRLEDVVLRVLNEART